MPSAFDEWITYDAKACDRLRTRVKQHLDGSPSKTTDALAEAAQYTNLRKWVKGYQDHKRISESNYYRLVLVGLRDGWLGFDTRPLSQLFAHWLELQSPDQTRVDHYEVYRYSFMASGFVLRGRMSVTYESTQITTQEMYRIQADVAKLRKIGEGDLLFPRSGLLFKRGKRNSLIVSKRDPEPREIQAAFLEESAAGHVMSGPFCDWHGSKFYAGRMYASKLNQRLSDDDVLALKPEQIAKDVDNYLTTPGPDVSSRHALALIN
jgi:hypothetical protein